MHKKFETNSFPNLELTTTPRTSNYFVKNISLMVATSGGMYKPIENMIITDPYLDDKKVCR